MVCFCCERSNAHFISSIYKILAFSTLMYLNVQTFFTFSTFFICFKLTFKILYKSFPQILGLVYLFQKKYSNKPLFFLIYLYLCIQKYLCNGIQKYHHIVHQIYFSNISSYMGNSFCLVL